MNKVRLAVIGVGHLGQIHARLMAQVSGAELVGIVDPCERARTAIGNELNVPAFADHAPLLDRIDAAIIATPSRLHYAVASDLLAQGIHVFVEKPMTLNIGDADGLIQQAAASGLVLQIGHVERFNPAFEAAAPHIGDPKYIDAVRCGPFTGRSIDIGVVLDLMIHDIDLVLSLVDDELISVEALGAAVIGPNEDWAQARLTFGGGCVANLFASRVVWQPQRSMQVISGDGAAAIDLAGRKAKWMRVGDEIAKGHVNVGAMNAAGRSQLTKNLFTQYLPTEEAVIQDANPLLEEQRAFVAAIHGEQQVRVSGSDGRRALDVAEKVLSQIAGHRWDGISRKRMGPRFEVRDPILRGPHWNATTEHRKAG